MPDLLKDSQEESLYIQLGKCLNDFILKTNLPPHRILRVLNNMTAQVLQNVEREQD